MAESLDRSFIVGIDIGSSKVAAAIGEYVEEELHIHGMAYEKIRCVKEGTISEIEPLVKAINTLIKQIEKEAECEIYSLSTTIAGRHIHGEKSHGSAPIRGAKHPIVSNRDLQMVLDTAGAVPLEKEQKVIHILPSHYKIDNQEGIRNPIGMTGVRLEADAYVVAAADNAIQNITNSLERCELQLDSVVFQGIASSYSVLSRDEKDLGVCLIDIGSGTTDVTVYSKGAVIFTVSLPVAGERVTRDIAQIKRLQNSVAEIIKIEYGSCLPERINPDDVIELPVISNLTKGKVMRRQELAQIIEPRYEELFRIIKTLLTHENIYLEHGYSVVLTGGGAKIKGGILLAEKVFEVPARLGVPQNVLSSHQEFDDPTFSALSGLLIFHQRTAWQKKLQNTVPNKGFFSNIYNYIKKTF